MNKIVNQNAKLNNANINNSDDMQSLDMMKLRELLDNDANKNFEVISKTTENDTKA